MTTDTTSSVPAGDRGTPTGRAPVFSAGTRPPQAPPRTFNVGRAAVRRPGEGWAPPPVAPPHRPGGGSGGRHAAATASVPVPGAQAGRARPASFNLPASFARPGRLVPPDEPRVAWREPAVDWRRVAVRLGGNPAAMPRPVALDPVAPDPSGRFDRPDPTATEPSGGISVITRPRVDPDMIAHPAEGAPASGRLIAVCVWATVVSLVGSVLAIRSSVEVFVGAPGWFLPVSGLVGLVGVGCTVAALCLARTRVVPWTLLGVSSCALGLAAYLIALADAARAATGS